MIWNILVLVICVFLILMFSGYLFKIMYNLGVEHTLEPTVSATRKRSQFDINIKIVAYGEQGSGKTVVLNELRKFISEQPDVKIEELDPDGHAFNIKGVWERK